MVEEKKKREIKREEKVYSVIKVNNLNWGLLSKKKVFFVDGGIEKIETVEGYYPKLESVVNAYVEARFKNGMEKGEMLEILKINVTLAELKEDIQRILKEKV